MGRAPCCDHKDGLKKGPWLPEEDQKLIGYIQEHGPGNWRALPKKAGLCRCGKSCRLRWTNYLRPDIKRGRFTFEEEEAIIQLHSVLGNKWSAIAAKLPGRTDNEIKNYWNTHIRKRLLRMGVDPVTHTRHFDLLNLPSILNSPLQNSNHQFNFLNLLNLQNLVNPDLLRLAALLSPTQNPNLNSNQQSQDQNPNFLLPSHQQNEIVDTSSMQKQYHQVVQTDNQTPIGFQNSSSGPSCSTMTNVFGGGQVMQPSIDEATFTSFDMLKSQTCPTVNNDHWENNVLINQQCDNSDRQQNESQYVSNYHQVISDDFLLKVPDLLTPGISEETPSNSNSEFPNSSITNTTTEDEIDSYCRSLMNFDIPPDFFNV